MYDYDGLTLNCFEKGCQEYLCVVHYNKRLKRGVTRKPKDDDPNWFCRKHTNKKVRFEGNMK